MFLDATVVQRVVDVFRVNEPRSRKLAGILGAVALILAAPTWCLGATWTRLSNNAPSSVGLMVQLTDGTILVQGSGQTWMKLSPDAHGSYINGTWTVVAPEPTARLYFASNMLPNGNLFVSGGEYAGPGLLANWSNTGEIYNAVSNTWTPIAPYPNQAGCPQIKYVSGNLTAGSSHITNIYPYASKLVVGWAVSGTGIPTGATILSIDSATQITISSPATATRTASTVNFSNAYQLVGCLGDEPSKLLPGGKILVGDLINRNTYVYDSASDSWALGAPKVYADQSDEEGWAQASDGTIVTYDLFHSIGTGGSYAERYNIASGTWSSVSPSDGTAAGSIPILTSSALGYELGPLLRLLDGRILVIGANQHTAIYNSSTTPVPTWSPGSDITGILNGLASPFGADDAAAAIVPNGHVIFSADAGPSAFTASVNITLGSNIITGVPSTAILQVNWPVSGTGIPSGSRITSVDSPTQVHISHAATATGVRSVTFGGTFSFPTQLFDFNPSTGTISPLLPALPDPNLSVIPAYVTRMLVLPTGQLMFADSSSQIWVYTPDGAPVPASRPVIDGVSYTGSGVFTLSGKQLNGQSAGAAYGDDEEMDSNYPIVRMTNSTGNVYYARTTNWSNVGVGGMTPETVNFTLNPAMAPGNYSVVVSGAGISSFPQFVNITADELAGL